MDATVIVAVIAALAVGALLGWSIGSRGAAEGKGVAESLRLQLDGVREERDGHARTIELLRSDHARAVDAMRADHEAAISSIRASHLDLTARHSALVAAQDERDQAHQKQLDALETKFAEVGGQMLERAEKKFLERADQRFKESEATSGSNLKALLQPVHERLKRYEEVVGKVEEDRRKDFGLLTGHIEAMKNGTERVSAEAAKLVNALRNAPKARGRWGEQQLRNVLESCGLSEHADFATEVSRSDEEGGRLRPDVIVRVPGGQSLVIDAKVSLNAYQDAFGAVDEAERGIHLATHAAAIRAHVNSLGNKAYWAQFPDAPDYVVMFIPGEHFLSAALEQDSALWDYAFDKRVLLATPTNLIAIARTVAAVWRQEKLAKEARQIGELGKELYDRLAKAASDLRKVGSGLTSAVNNYNSFVSSFESRSLVTARKFRDLNIEPSAREIEAVPPVEALARYGDDKVLPPPSANEDEAAA
ncbi:DNA recombination protein RmuC [Sphingomonas sp. LY29]|uniref:DNA recombination protein RmuC n=1 Tax=unclassified Sphingomonas TaxID=196159 RepID=UPI002ADEAC63|nr:MULTISPECIES: DNA recombination protein RmuC [unclassified Sphingomonas]MEA1071358.1 DNA recombination protein RmuC [Sphingomonas sp. LY160]WRP25956.1 DNA recombination protein RmuC [Sphingomonas sp. LY29]